jgi:hypothetical protein
MLISDEHRFAFVHIPKCGGTTVRAQLRGVDSYRGLFEGFNSHPVLGIVDYQHIPLSILRQYFPEVYQKICAYESFVILRSPLERFLSSVRQRIRDFKDVPDVTVTDQMIAKEANEVLDYLNSGGNSLKREYVHFLRQSDFVFDQGSRIIKNVCTLSNTAVLETFIRTNIRPDFRMSQEENVSKKIRSATVERAASMLAPAAKRLLSLRARARVWTLMMTLGIAERARLKGTNCFDTKIVERVIEYYKADVDLYDAFQN